LLLGEVEVGQVQRPPGLVSGLVGCLPGLLSVLAGLLFGPSSFSRLLPGLFGPVSLALGLGQRLLGALSLKQHLLLCLESLIPFDCQAVSLGEGDTGHGHYNNDQGAYGA
jgi:hypothetical protein